MPDAPDSLARFAADLKMLRIDAGNPTLGHLQHGTGISRTVISEAYSGRHLPSTRTVHGLVRACGADPVPWVRRRDALAAARATDAPEESGPAAPDEQAPARAPRAPRSPRSPRRRFALTVLIAFAAGAVIATGITAAVMGGEVSALKDRLAEGARPVSPQAARIQVRTGVDPAMTPCVNDATVVASATRAHDTRLQIFWSDNCSAGWARVARHDGKGDGNAVSVWFYAESDPNGPERQSDTEPNAQSAYTSLIVRPSDGARLCAAGRITLGGTKIDLGDPICV